MIAVEIKPWCAAHQRMGEWKVHYFYESIGGRAYSPVDSVDVIVCEECP